MFRRPSSSTGTRVRQDGSGSRQRSTFRSSDQAVLESQNHLASLLKDTQRTEEAEQVHRRAVAVYEKLAADYADEPEYRCDLAWRHYQLGNFLRDTGRQTEAVQAYQTGTGRLREISGRVSSKLAPTIGNGRISACN